MRGTLTIFQSLLTSKTLSQPNVEAENTLGALVDRV